MSPIVSFQEELQKSKRERNNSNLYSDWKVSDDTIAEISGLDTVLEDVRIRHSQSRCLQKIWARTIIRIAIERSTLFVMKARIILGISDSWKHRWESNHSTSCSWQNLSLNVPKCRFHQVAKTVLIWGNYIAIFWPDGLLMGASGSQSRGSRSLNNNYLQYSSPFLAKSVKGIYNFNYYYSIPDV